MSVYCRSVFTLFFPVLGALLLVACNKATINFGDEALTEDPNIIYIDSLTVAMATYQTDSFYTAGDTVFIAGVHVDSLLGSYTAKSYMQLGIPAVNNIKGRNNCTFDSLVLIIRFYGSYYGDTTEPFTLKAHRLLERMDAESNKSYNVNSMAYDATPLGTVTLTSIRPSAKAAVSVPLPQELGRQLFRMLNKESDTITQPEKFYRYFNGIALSGEGEGKRSAYYFCTREPGNATVMRLYYREQGVTPQSLYTDFPITPASFQFNGFAYDKTGTPLQGFVPKKVQVVSASLTGNKSFLHSNSGLFPYFNIPSLFSIKELHPYVKVIKAELEIKPPELNYTSASYYKLPPALALYTLDAGDRIGTPIYNANGTALQTGDLSIDYLYHKDTRYTYDLTTYVNDIIEKGRFHQKPLVLIPISRGYESRLILNAMQNNSSVQLKLYVLGL